MLLWVYLIGSALAIVACIVSFIYANCKGTNEERAKKADRIVPVLKLAAVLFIVVSIIPLLYGIVTADWLLIALAGFGLFTLTLVFLSNYTSKAGIMAILITIYFLIWIAAMIDAIATGYLMM